MPDYALPKPELLLIGAGPGDPELITLKAYRALQQARVVLYDNLANTALLDWTPSTCEKIYVGKLPYGAYTPQETIHALIKEKAFAVGQVVRLKGGDPFVFGRGFEEILFARQQGIAVSYIPGISSMQAAGLSAIPLTHRNISESIWVVTGTKKDGSLSEDLKLAMKSKATVVIYMGMKKVKEIAAVYREEGYGSMPAAIIQHASLPQQKMAVGTAGDLPELVAAHGLSHPAIIIIGEVVAVGQAAVGQMEGMGKMLEAGQMLEIGQVRAEEMGVAINEKLQVSGKPYEIRQVPETCSPMRKAI